MTALANGPQRAFFSISTRGTLWHLRNRNPWAAITCCRTKPCLTEIILSLCFFFFFFPRVCCAGLSSQTTHHRSRRCLHSVRGHSRSNLLHCRAGGAWGEERKHDKKYLLNILNLKRELEGYRTCPKKGKYPCDSDNWRPACLLIGNYI